MWEGWSNKLFTPKGLKDLIEQTSEGRKKICLGCVQDSIVAKERGINFHSSWRPDEHCIICQCNLDAKRKCLSCNCPIHLWDAVVSEEEDQQIEIQINGNSSI